MGSTGKRQYLAVKTKKDVPWQTWNRLVAGMSAVDALRKTVARLRGPDGCPWDQEQDHTSLRICLIEECCELLDTIDRLDFDHMREELGDVLLQVIFHTQLAEEEGRFDLESVAAEINEKLIRRHPHVFGDARLDTSDEVLHQWDQIKAVEKGDRGADSNGGLFHDLPLPLPGLLQALEVAKRLKKKSIATDGVVDQAGITALADGLTEIEAGRRLFEYAAACREAGIDPESALRDHTRSVIEKLSERHERDRG
jgi:XTP/dITP diphosphohydrolase/tetrapyrrole methylase family protein/MazG family protein